MSVLDQRHGESLAHEAWNELFDQGRLAAARPSGKSKYAWRFRVHPQSSTGLPLDGQDVHARSREATASAASPACVMRPSDTCIPARSPGSSSSACWIPRAAITRTYGSVAPASASVAVRGTSAGMLGTQ